MQRAMLVVLSALLAGLGAAAQGSAAAYDGTAKVFRLDGGNVTYAFGVNPRGELQQLYWGGRLGATDRIPAAVPKREAASFDSSYTTTPQEYAGWGAGLFVEPAIKVTFTDGNRDLVLHYDRHESATDGFNVVLKDIKRNVFVTLHYSIDPVSGILSRSATIENKEEQPITIEQAAAAAWSVPAGHYTLDYLTGRWGGEWTLTQEKLSPGERVIESRRGSTGHQANPWFAIEAGDAPDENAGEVWFGALAWSGSWRITVEQDQLDAIRVTGGFNPFDFGYVLKPGEKLETPVFYGGYSAHGLGGASRLLHHYEVAHVLPRRVGDGEDAAPKPRPVIYNSWEATEMNVSEEGQIALAEKAAALGVDRFVMDDGWFGQRKTDHAGLGDWYVNSQKFPHGLKPLIDKVHALHMDFGLWVEPEMVNPDSDLYRKHPDWVLNFPGRPRSESRNQLVLNLARQDVRDYVLGFLDKLLNENDIAFLKWDYNRNWSEPGWDQLPPNEQKEVYVAFTRNLYWVLSELKKRHPKVELESCSGGGGRVDLGILQYADEVWPSDNTDPFDRLTQQDGFTYAYTPQVMMAWVTDSPHWGNKRSTSLQYRMLSSMQGSLGIGANITKFTDQEMATAKRLIAAYHQVQKTIVQGDLYRLISPRNGSEFSATQTVNKDKSQSVVFAFIHSTQEGRGFPILKLKGLDPKAEYTLTPIEGAVLKGSPTTASGAWWMNHGLVTGDDFRGDFQAAAFRLDRK
ncbi:alpha-galactosidase [Occallatibacter savannae]|uniref:alpha-galactosidase n=1 Tax=Occallatibacter savannae TaxID=1002691 RepID=UPI000D696997|nr:alpha-galactosidase [Occallatibacter savannae]